MADEMAIQTRQLVKSYGAVEALRGMDLNVARGSIHGFLGRNGAGKTTTLKILLGMAHAGSGEARVLGLDARSAQESVEIRRRIFFVSEEKELPEAMQVNELLRFTASFYPKWDRAQADRYLRQFDVPRDRQVKALSRGTRAKLALAMALSSGAELLLLDEPTAGLDPAAAETVLQALAAFAGESGGTIFLSSHQLSEIEQIADHITIVNQGRVVLARELDELRAQCRRIDAVFGSDAAAIARDGIICLKASSRSLSLIAAANVEPIVSALWERDAVSVDVAPVSLKEVFLALSGEAQEVH